jgi:hypothetical protein
MIVVGVVQVFFHPKQPPKPPERVLSIDEACSLLGEGAASACEPICGVVVISEFDSALE